MNIDENKIQLYLNKIGFSDINIKKMKSKDINLIKKSTFFVNRLFKEKKDKSGQPYIGHLKRVSNKVGTDEEKCVALLHDTLEDIEGMTPEVLQYIGIPDNIIEAVKLITKPKEKMDYEIWIDKIIESGNILAIKVKYADMSDNMNPERLEKLPDDIKKRLENKYEKPFEKLKKAILNINNNVK